MKKRPLQLTATLLQLFFATVTVAADSQTTERISEVAERAAVDALPRTPFFATDAAVARGEPGTLIRSEEFAGYDLPADVRATRILYRSRSELDHEVVASTAVRAYPRLTSQECRLVGSALFEPVKLPADLDARWTAAPLVQRLITENLVGKKPIAGPMLVAGADGDDTIPAQLLASRVKELCATGSAVDYQVYPGDHESMLVTSFSDQMSWIMDRFQERKSAGNCK
jgi:hypothetical protein